MPRTLYSPRLSDDVVRALYRAGKRQRKPMTRLADELLRNALAVTPALVALPSVADNIIPYRTRFDSDAA
jgi:hypothetical protein